MQFSGRMVAQNMQGPRFNLTTSATHTQYYYEQVYWSSRKKEETINNSSDELHQHYSSITMGSHEETTIMDSEMEGQREKAISSLQFPQNIKRYPPQRKKSWKNIGY